MFCQNCGKQNPDGTTFCMGCGASLSGGGRSGGMGQDLFGGGGGAMTTGQGGQYNNSSSGAKAIPIVAIVVVVALVVGALFLFGVLGGGPERVVKKSFKALVNGDGDDYFEATLDPYLLEYYIDRDRFEDEEDAREKCMDVALEAQERAEDEFGRDVKCNIEILRTTEYEKHEVEELAEYLAEQSDDTYPEDALQDICVLKVRLTMEGSEDRDSDTQEIVAIKIDGDWYLNNTFFGGKSHIENILD